MPYQPVSPGSSPEDFYIQLFRALPGNCLLLKTDAPRFTIIAATPDYSEPISIKHDDLIGKGLFEVFPSNPDDATDTGEKNLRASLEYVLKNKAAHELPVHRHDSKNSDGSFTERYWSSTNTPVLSSEGQVSHIVHCTVEVTEKVMTSKKVSLGRDFEKAYKLFMTAPVIIGVLTGDDYVIELANEGLLEVWGRTDKVIGQPLMNAIPELKTQGFLELLDQVRITGKAFYAYEYPITLVRHGKEEVVYFDFVYKPFYEDVTYTKASGVVSVGHDVTTQVMAKRKVQESEERFRKLADESPMFVFIIDAHPAGLVSYWNKTWLQYTGQSMAEAEGSAWMHIVHPDDVAVIMQYYQPAFEKKQSYFIPSIRIKRHDGVYRWHAFKANPRYLANGEFNGFIGVGLDIHEQKLAEEALKASEVRLQQEVAERTIDLQRTVEELKRSNSNLEDFAYAASHDLKEPIRKIHFFSDRLKHELSNQLTENQRHLFQRLEHASFRMRTLIDDLLTYSYVTKGSTDNEEIDLNKNVDLVLTDLEVEIQQKNATIIVNPLPKIRGNRRQLQQVFQNLISNALKYNKPQTAPRIVISSSLVQDTEVSLRLPSIPLQREYYLIQVMDNGTGFEQKDAEKIFNVFTRLHGGTEYSGTGIGLSIVRKVVENHKGSIWAESQPGQGSIFKILLPV